MQTLNLLIVPTFIRQYLCTRRPYIYILEIDNFFFKQKKSPKADENIRSIKTELADAVDDCTKAAGHEFSTDWQRALLKAASFGKAFLESYNVDNFVNMCMSLRVLNEVRYYEVGIPITYEQ